LLEDVARPAAVRQKRHEFSGKSQVFFSSREEEEEVEVEGEGEVGGET